MKKTLLLIFSLLIFVGNVWAWTQSQSNIKLEKQTSGGFNISKSCPNNLTFKLYNAYYWFDVDVTVKQYDSSSKSKLYQTDTKKYDGNAWGSVTECSVTLNSSTGYIEFYNTATNKKYVVTVSEINVSGSDSYLKITSSTSLAFGNVEAGTTSSAKTITVSYSSTEANVSSSNSAFKVTPTSVGNSSCGKTGTQNITVTFNPTSIGNQSGTITIGNNTISVSGTGTLASPTGVKVTPAYDTAELSWNSVSGAESYLVTYGDSTKTVTSTSLTCDGLELGTKYTFSVQAQAQGTSSDASSVQGTTNDLSASTSFTLSDATYTTCHGSWAQIPNATGYKVVASNGAATYFDGGGTTSGTIAGLLPNNSYTCTVYGMYNNSVSKKGKTSNSVSTLTTKCETESLGSASIESKGGFNWDDKYSKTFTTSRNQATISFRFNTSSGVATGAEFFVQESSDGSTWSRINSWSSTSNNGSGSVKLTRGKFKFRFVYSGNFGATISEVHAVQASYMEVSTTNIDFGNIVYGNSASETITIPFSTMVSNITTTNPYYTFDKTSVGDDDCSYGTESLKITFNKNKDAAIGEQNTTIYIGSNAINITATITLPVPELSLSSKSYQNVVLSWGSIAGAEKYRINCAGKEPVWINAADFEGSYTYGGLLQNTEYTFTVQAYGGGKITDESNAVTTKTLSLAAPTIEASNIGYEIATLTWSVVEDAADYELYDERTGKSYIFAKGTNSATIDTLSLHTTYTYRIYSRLADETRSLTYGTVTFSTTDLQPSTSFTLSNISYNAMDAEWAPVENATGYMIRERWSRMVLTFGANETSTTIYGLKPGTLYEFYLYATYNEVPATDSHRISATGKTLEPNCPVQIVEDHTFGCDNIVTCGFDWSDKTFNIDITKNAPILSFNFEIAPTATKNSDELTKWGPYLRVEEYKNGGWSEVWRFTRSSSSNGGSAQIDNLQRGTRKVRIIYHGNLWCNVSGITISQGTYFTLDKSSLPFGEHYVGAASVTQTVTADYSSQAASVVSTDTDLFSTSKETLGDGECGYGTDNVTITANTALEPGTYNAELIIGRDHLPMSVTILELPAPNNFVIAEQNPTSAVLTWDDVNITETGYKVVCKQGNDIIETKNVGGDVTTCTFTSLAPNTEYTYTITTMYNTIENGSAEVSGTTNHLPAPQNFALDAASVRAFSARFTWTEVTGATGYKLEWQWNDEIETETDIVGNVSEYRITELKPNTTYNVKITTLYGSEEQETSDAVEVTTTCVVNTTATGDEPTSQLHTITLLSGAQLDDLSYVQGAVIKFKSYTESQHIKFVQLNVTMNNSRVTFTEPEVELTVSSNIYIESVYEYAGIAQVVDEHGDVVYGTLTDAVNAAEEGATINLLGDVEQDMVVNKYIKFNGNGHDIDNLYIKKNGNVELTGDVTIVKDFGLEVTPDKAGQYSESSSELVILGDAYIDVQFDNVKRDKWYAFTVPFPVKMDEVKNAQTLSPLVYGTDYLFLGFDGEARAKGEKGWIRYTTPGTLEPGQLYMIGTYGSTVHRFYKVKSAALVSNAVSFDLESHASAKGGNLADWNALGNSQLFNVDANQHGTQFDEDVIAQIYQSATDSYLAVQLREHVMSVTNPIFVQRTEKCTNVSINKTDGLRSANAESALYNLQIAKEGAANFDDQMFVAASDNAPSEYVAGYALMKLGLTNSIAQIYSNMYNTNLCMIKAPYAANSVADIPFTLYAPAAGNYTLSLGKQVSDGTALYLVKDGTEIHEFNADGSYTVYLAKGTSNSYSLRLKSTDSEDITTPAAETEASNVKVYVQEGVLVIEGLAEGGNYAVGNMIRTLYSGASNGGDVRIPLTEKGVYWVNAGSAKVKVLNK